MIERNDFHSEHSHTAIRQCDGLTRQVDGLIGRQGHEPSAIRQCDASSGRPVRGLVRASIRPVERFLKVNILPIWGASWNILGTSRGRFAPEAQRKIAMGTM